MLPRGRRCRMDSSWHDTKLLRDSIRHAYRVICQELTITNESQRAIRRCAWASACVAELPGDDSTVSHGQPARCFRSIALPQTR